MIREIREPGHTERLRGILKPEGSPYSHRAGVMDNRAALTHKVRQVGGI